MVTDTATTSAAPERVYLPTVPDGFESFIIRQWRATIQRRHGDAEGVTIADD